MSAEAADSESSVSGAGSGASFSLTDLTEGDRELLFRLAAGGPQAVLSLSSSDRESLFRLDALLNLGQPQPPHATPDSPRVSDSSSPPADTSRPPADKEDGGEVDEMVDELGALALASRGYFCMRCKHRFAGANELVAHMAQSHSQLIAQPGLPRFQCPACKLIYQQQADWASHYLTQHPSHHTPTDAASAASTSSTAASAAAPTKRAAAPTANGVVEPRAKDVPLAKALAKGSGQGGGGVAANGLGLAPGVAGAAGHGSARGGAGSGQGGAGVVTIDDWEDGNVESEWKTVSGKAPKAPKGKGGVGRGMATAATWVIARPELGGDLEEGYVCDDCGGRTATPDDLVEHVWEEHGKTIRSPSEPKHFCGLCTQYCGGADTLARHVALAHPHGDNGEPLRDPTPAPDTLNPCFQCPDCHTRYRADVEHARLAAARSALAVPALQRAFLHARAAHRSPGQSAPERSAPNQQTPPPRHQTPSDPNQTVRHRKMVRTHPQTT